MKTIFSLMVLGALSIGVSGCAHHGHDHGHHGKSCCKEKKDCKDGSCKLKKDKSCCEKEKKEKKKK